MAQAIIPIRSGTDAAIPSARPADRRWDALMLCLAVYILTAVGRLNNVVMDNDPLHIPMLAAGGAITLLLLDPKRTRRLSPALGLPPIRWMLLLLLWITFSVPGALYPGVAFWWLGLITKTVVMSIVMVAAVRGPHDVRRLAGVYFVGVAIFATVVLIRFRIDANNWRLEELAFYDPNDFATIAVSAMPIGLYFSARQGPLLLRAAAFLGIATLGVAFIWCGSRGGLFALIGAAVYFTARYTAIRAHWRMLGLGVCTVFFLAIASDQFWKQMGTIVAPEQDYNVTSEGGRVKIWKRGLGYISSNPLLGVGAGNFPVAEGTISTLVRSQETGRGVRWSAAHNTYVQAGAELGIVGLALFCGMFVMSFMALNRVKRRGRDPTVEPDSAQLSMALTVGMIGFLIGAFFLSFLYLEATYALVALAAALLKVAGRPSLPLGSLRRARG